MPNVRQGREFLRGWTDWCPSPRFSRNHLARSESCAPTHDVISCNIGTRHTSTSEKRTALMNTIPASPSSTVSRVVLHPPFFFISRTDVSTTYWNVDGGRIGRKHANSRGYDAPHDAAVIATFSRICQFCTRGGTREHIHARVRKYTTFERTTLPPPTNAYSYFLPAHNAANDARYPEETDSKAASMNPNRKNINRTPRANSTTLRRACRACVTC